MAACPEPLPPCVRNLTDEPPALALIAGATTDLRAEHTCEGSLMSQRWKAAILALAAAACSPTPSGPKADTARYDSSPKAFAAFAAEQHQDWPAPVEMGTFQAPDGAPLRYARWTPPGGGRAGTVVFFQGRTEFIEKNIYAYKDLLEDGYDVWTLDWRGQGLSHRPLSGTDKG